MNVGGGEARCDTTSGGADSEEIIPSGAFVLRPVAAYELARAAD